MGSDRQTSRQQSFCLSLCSEVSGGLRGGSGARLGHLCRAHLSVDRLLLPETAPVVRPAGPGEAQEPEELARRQRRHPELSQGEAVASVIIYRTLAGLLPHNYDPDKRSLR